MSVIFLGAKGVCFLRWCAFSWRFEEFRKKTIKILDRSGNSLQCNVQLLNLKLDFISSKWVIAIGREIHVHISGYFYANY